MWKRLVCRVLGHEPTKIPRDDEGGGYVLGCRRCGVEGLPPKPRKPVKR